MTHQNLCLENCWKLFWATLIKPEQTFLGTLGASTISDLYSVLAWSTVSSKPAVSLDCNGVYIHRLLSLCGTSSSFFSFFSCGLYLSKPLISEETSTKGWTLNCQKFATSSPHEPPVETDFWRFWRAWHRAYYVINFESSDWLAGKIINKTLSPVFTVVNVAGRPTLPSRDPDSIHFQSWNARQLLDLYRSWLSTFVVSMM